MYAFILTPNQASRITIAGLDAGTVTDVRLLGGAEPVPVTAHAGGIEIQLPDRPPSEAAITLDLGTQVRMLA